VTDPSSARAPIFIVGAMRSGTTLMRLMLNRHPDVSIPAESHFVSELLRRFGPDVMLQGDTLEQALEMITTHTEWQRDWHDDPDDLVATARRGAPFTMAAFIDLLFTREIASTGKPLWGDKTPSYLRRVEELLLCFPDARFIGMVRDPRDVHLSLKSKGWVGTTPWEIARYQRACAELTRRHRRSRPECFMIVRYEDLVLHAEETLRASCEFLGIPFDSDMLDFHEDAAEHVQQWELETGAHEKLLRPPSASDVGRWPREASRIEVAETEAIMGEALEWFGYERTLPPTLVRPLRIEARVRFHARRPRRAARKLLGSVRAKARLSPVNPLHSRAEPSVLPPRPR
jgi:hypothetical protein